MYGIKLSIDIEKMDDENETSGTVAEMARYYEVESLDRLAEIVANFGKVSAALIEAEKLGSVSD